MARRKNPAFVDDKTGRLMAPVDSIELLAGNPRRGDVPAIAVALTMFGQRFPIVVNRRKAPAGSVGVAEAGNHTLLAARSLGWGEVWIDVVDDDESVARAFSLAANRLQELGGNDDAELVAMMEEVRAADVELLAAAGWTDDDLLELKAGLEGDDGPDPDAVPAAPVPPVSKLGDLWLLGEHRVLCGSATDEAAVAAVLAGDDAVWTDPPYNVNYSKGKAGKVLNDDLSDAEFAELIGSALVVAAGVLRKGGAIYVAHAETERAVFTNCFLAAGLKLSSCLIWRNNTATLGRSDYQWQHEPILYGWRPGARHRWFGGRNKTTVVELEADGLVVAQPDGSLAFNLGDRVVVVGSAADVQILDSSVVEVDKPARSELHPTTKPVALIERALLNSSRSGDVVLDPFGGSGSTLIAAERLRRRARLIDLKPELVDVTCRRFQEYSGVLPVLEATGVEHDFAP